jgi:hypothetical protein
MRARIALVGAATVMSCCWLATPALATGDYPIVRPTSEATSTSTGVGGVKVEQSGLAHTGGSLAPLWGGLGLLGAGGVVVVAARRRSHAAD